jgi:hypothetical protein
MISDLKSLSITLIKGIGKGKIDIIAFACPTISVSRDACTVIIGDVQVGAASSKCYCSSLC